VAASVHEALGGDVLGSVGWGCERAQWPAVRGDGPVAPSRLPGLRTFDGSSQTGVQLGPEASGLEQ
jgi:hypothetical protein